MTKIQPLPVVALIAFLWAADSCASFRCTSANGKTTFSQRVIPGQGCTEMTIRTTAPKVAQEAPEPAAPLQDRGPAPDGVGDVFKQNCETARKNLEIFSSATSYRTSDGRAIYLNDELRAEKVREAQGEIDAYCRP